MIDPNQTEDENDEYYMGEEEYREDRFGIRYVDEINDDYPEDDYLDPAEAEDGNYPEYD